MNMEHLHKSDIADALRFAASYIDANPPSSDAELNRARLYILQELAREADREARK